MRFEADQRQNHIRVAVLSTRVGYLIHATYTNRIYLLRQKAPIWSFAFLHILIKSMMFAPYLWIVQPNKKAYCKSL